MIYCNLPKHLVGSSKEAQDKIVKDEMRNAGHQSAPHPRGTNLRKGTRWDLSPKTEHQKRMRENSGIEETRGRVDEIQTHRMGTCIHSRKDRSYRERRHEEFHSDKGSRSTQHRCRGRTPRERDRMRREKIGLQEATWLTFPYTGPCVAEVARSTKSGSLVHTHSLGRETLLAHM